MTQSDEVTIVYWPVTFRGNFLKLICEAKGVSYKETTSSLDATEFVLRPKKEIVEKKK